MVLNVGLLLCQTHFINYEDDSTVYTVADTGWKVCFDVFFISGFVLNFAYKIPGVFKEFSRTRN